MKILHACHLFSCEIPIYYEKFLLEIAIYFSNSFEDKPLIYREENLFDGMLNNKI